MEQCNWDLAWDDVNGGGLPWDLVVGARAEEVGFMRERNIWDERLIEECGLVSYAS